MNEKIAVNILAALAQETRLRIVRYLIQCGPEGASAGDVGKHVDAIPSRASFHLSTLENAGVVSSERQSRHIIYRADFENVGGVISFMLNDCCGNHPNIRSCCNLNGECC